MSSIKQQARAAGFLYFLIGISAPIGLEVVPSRLIVRGDATATAANLVASEWLFRLGIVSELFHQAVCVFLVVALYRLFRAVDERQAVLLVILGALVSVPIVFLNVVNEIAALILVSGAGFLSAFTKPELDALAYLFLRLHGQGIQVASVFWGLWLFPFGILVVRSGFIPRVFGILLFLAGAGYLIDCVVTFLLPQYGPRVSPFVTALEIGEVPIILWLLIWGAREKASAVPAPA